jgi:hypothetical protein
MKNATAVLQTIEKKIHFVRGHKVMLDSDLAELYGVTTGNLNLAVRRNRGRFPADFTFQPTAKEWKSLILQFAISKGRGGRRQPPSLFTEQGVAMLSSVLKTERAIRVNVMIMRAFVQLREMTSFKKEINLKIGELERKMGKHDGHIHDIFQALHELMNPPASTKRKIGFR